MSRIGSRKLPTPCGLRILEQPRTSIIADHCLACFIRVTLVLSQLDTFAKLAN